jgi:hypothetical protein
MGALACRQMTAEKPSGNEFFLDDGRAKRVYHLTMPREPFKDLGRLTDLMHSNGSRGAPRLVACWVAAASMCVAGPVSAAPALRCGVAGPASVLAGEPVVLRFTLANPGPLPLYMLRWNTPFEEAWLAPFVEVARDGRPVPYQGPMVKRAEPGPASYLRIEARSSVVAQVSLAPVFEVGVPGRYRVQPRLHLADLRVAHAGPIERPRAQHAGVDLACPAVDFSVLPATR